MNTSAPAQWFRMYAEFAVDPKVQMLSEIDQRRFVMLLCLRCCNGNVTLHETEVAFQLRISEDEWAKTKAVLLGKKLIHNNNTPTSWDKRQYASDSSTARVNKHRDNVKRFGNVTKEKCNGDVTAPETETETEKRREELPAKAGLSSMDLFEEFYNAYPKKKSRGQAEKTWRKINPDRLLVDTMLASIEIAKKTEDWTKEKGKYIPYPSSWLTSKGWQDDMQEQETGQRWCDGPGWAN